MGVTSSGLAVRGSIKSLGFVLFVTLVVIFISIGALLVRFETQKQEQIQRDQTMETLYTLRASLSSRIYMNIYRIPAVNSIIAMNTELTQEDFTRAIKVQFTEEHDFRNIAIARDMIVQFVYPLEGNETVVGLDYTTIPDQIESVEKAIQQNELVIAGPVALVQGGEGIIARNPIYVSNPVTGEDIFWGLSSSVLYADSLFNAAGIVPEVDGLLIAIRGKDALGPDGDVFMGDPSVFESSPLQQNIELPYGSWQIAAVPAGGWLAETIFFTPLLWAYYIGVVILLGFTALVIRLTITRQDAITALLDAENRLQKTAYELTENIPVGTYTMVQPPEGGLGKFAFLSRRFLELTGLRREDALVDPMKAFACSHPDDFDDWIALNAESFAEKKAFYGETRIIVNGEIRWVKAESRPRSLPDGSTVWEGVLTDITDQKQLEEQLIQEKENAEAANVAKSQFLANMSHEIRTPLNGLIGFTDLLKNTPLSAVQQQYVNNAHVSGHTLLSVISDILDFSKIEAGKLELESRKTNLPELLEDSIDVVRFHAEKKGLELLLYIGDTVPELVYTDSVRLKQVLANLLGNAVKFTERGEVELSVDGELLDENVARLRFTVRDTGIGITEAQRDRLFNAFSQADTSTTRRFGGTGLGLAISEMIVNKMGGKIDFTSRPGVETTFFFTLTLPVEATQ
ncbi:MAG: CHASE domain-containing protein, partial [Balneolales bacterium]|nr:CHASE domain-containing protein [Balneolales bacterium]